MESKKEYQLIVSAEDCQKYKRLDHFLVDQLSTYSRTFIKQLFEEGLITSPQKLSLNKMPPPETSIDLEIPPPIPSEAIPQKIDLSILYEDEFLIVINKPVGLVVHPAPGHPDGTLVNALLYHCRDLTGIGQVERPGIVHRLDKGTSGVMVAAKTQKAHEQLVLMFSKHDLKRVYWALCLKSSVPLSGKLNSPLGRHPQHRKKMHSPVVRGKRAVTHYQVMTQNEKLMLLQCQLETGRTHQIRVHLSCLLKTPILMDPLYANPKQQLKKLGGPELLTDYEHPLLHAKTLEFEHPIHKKTLSFDAPPPMLFSQILEQEKIWPEVAK